MQYSQFIEHISRVKLEEIPASKIAGIISEYHNIDVNDSIVESYVELASSKAFTIDPAVHAIRALNTSTINGKIDYVLDDGSLVAIDENTQLKLNTLFDNKYELVEYMQKNLESFMHVLKELD